jgi:hypothetical protein
VFWTPRSQAPCLPACPFLSQWHLDYRRRDPVRHSAPLFDCGSGPAAHFWRRRYDGPKKITGVRISVCRQPSNCSFSSFSPSLATFLVCYFSSLAVNITVEPPVASPDSSRCPRQALETRDTSHPETGPTAGKPHRLRLCAVPDAVPCFCLSRCYHRWLDRVRDRSLKL